jgi:hypothetical protein
MKAKDLPTLNEAVNKLMGELICAQEGLRAAEQSCGTGHNLKKLLRLRDLVASIETRLQRAERLQEAALRSQR